MWPRRRPSPAAPNVDYGDLVPRRRVDATDGDDGNVVLLVPRYTDWLFGRFVQPRLKGDRRHIRVPLEARGSWVWRRVDGRRTVGDIAGAFAVAFPEDAEHAGERVGRYVASLVGNGFLETWYPRRDSNARPPD